MIRKLLYLTSISLSSLFIGCSDDTSMRNVDFDESAFLTNMGSGIIAPAYSDFASKTDALNESVITFSQELTTDNLLEVTSKLKDARLSWQSCNMFSFGPAGDIALTSEANIFPVDQIQIEKNIETGGYDLGTISNNDTKGLPAIAYLIHNEGQSEIEILESFISEAGRVQYLKDLSARLSEKAKAVSELWSNTYLSQFASSFGTSVGSSTSLLFNSMVRTYERNLRDGKIGIPVGVRSLGETIPNSTEAYHGGYSLELAKANLAVFKSLFNGQASSGFDDYLSAHGRDELVSEVNEKFDAILVNFNQLSDPLSEEITTNKIAVETTFVSMQDLVNLLKTDVASQLSISISFIDSDGD
ncbi:MAG: imelysin family protein [Cyclobacteriaceae bacterium]